MDRIAPKVWKREEIQAIYDSPLMELIFRSVSLIPPFERGILANPTFSQFPHFSGERAPNEPSA